MTEKYDVMDTQREFQKFILCNFVAPWVITVNCEKLVEE